MKTLVPFTKLNPLTEAALDEFAPHAERVELAGAGYVAHTPQDFAYGNLLLRVGLYNSAGQSLLSAKDGWVPQGDILQRSYHVGAGESISGGPTQTTWQVNNLGTTGTYTLVVGADVFTATYAPEPATICLLGLGAVGLLKKRRA